VQDMKKQAELYRQKTQGANDPTDAADAADAGVDVDAPQDSASQPPPSSSAPLDQHTINPAAAHAASEYDDAQARERAEEEAKGGSMIGNVAGGARDVGLNTAGALGTGVKGVGDTLGDTVYTLGSGLGGAGMGVARGLGEAGKSAIGRGGQEDEAGRK
jgi:hypothetical protein